MKNRLSSSTLLFSTPEKLSRRKKYLEANIGSKILLETNEFIL